MTGGVALQFPLPLSVPSPRHSLEAGSRPGSPAGMGTHQRPPFHHASTSYAGQSHQHHLAHSHSHPARQPSSVPSTSYTPYRDLPPTKEEAEIYRLPTPVTTVPPHSHSHSHPPHQAGPLQNDSRRGLYPTRRLPTGFTETMASRGAALRGRLMGKEGGLGRALILGWIATTLGFVIATAFWRGELFSALDQLSKDLFALGLEGKLIFGFLILLTTIPPLPLYSTLMVLSGYTFGVWEGFVVSYGASLIGAVLVFVVSRTMLRDVITKCLNGSPTAQSLLQIIPQNPHLLLLIRIAPYPYNLLNVILASSPALTLKTYTACTAVSLLKLVLHTWIGAGIHDLSASYNHPDHARVPRPPMTRPPQWHGPPHHHHHFPPPPTPEWLEEERHRQDVRMWSTWIGIGLCVALFFYLTHLAKRALAKAQAEQDARGDSEEGVAFLERDGREEA